MNKCANSRNLLLTGVAGPLTFAVSVIVGGELRAGYSHVDQFISELGETGSRFSWVMNYFWFWLSASLILIFVLTFRRYFPRNLLNAIGSVLLATFAINVGAMRGSASIPRRKKIRRLGASWLAYVLARYRRRQKH